NQVANAIGTIDQGTQQNAATSEEAAAAAEELNAQAMSMLASVEEIAKVVGLTLNTNANNRLTNKSNSAKMIHKVQPAKHIDLHLNRSPKKSIARVDNKSKGGDDVFPLDEHDLKEF
ncbi:MAG: chemotaxis protein, partial [Campylobacterales bacterium]|nr:chemotaxis protein [Campylobacterales bacterium]